MALAAAAAAAAAYQNNNKVELERRSTWLLAMNKVAGGVITCFKFPFIAYCNYAFMSVSCSGGKFYIGRLGRELRACEVFRFLDGILISKVSGQSALHNSLLPSKTICTLVQVFHNTI